MRIFLAAPFTEKIDPNTQLIETKYRNWLEMLIGFLERKGHQVINSHVREFWGEKLETPETALINDFTSIKNSQMVIAYLGNPPSPGVQMELGFATSMGKRVIILSKNKSKIPYLIKGMHKLTDAVFIGFDTQEDLITKLDKYV